jgi:hypothetical protein
MAPIVSSFWIPRCKPDKPLRRILVHQFYAWKAAPLVDRPTLETAKKRLVTLCKRCRAVDFSLLEKCCWRVICRFGTDWIVKSARRLLAENRRPIPPETIHRLHSFSDPYFVIGEAL